jgi:competence ComEA-like helix-hairpin-helix protein
MKRNFIASTFVRMEPRKELMIATLFLLASCTCVRLPRHSIAATQDVENNSNRPESHARINVNSASVTELQELPGVGKVLAERIVEYRDKYGPFRRAEHLMLVRGISESKFRELEPMITVELVDRVQ